MKSKIDSRVCLLGFKAKNKETGIEGVISHVSFDVYGLISYSILFDVDGEGVASDWIDEDLLEINTELGRVVEVADPLNKMLSDL